MYIKIILLWEKFFLKNRTNEKILFKGNCFYLQIFYIFTLNFSYFSHKLSPLFPFSLFVIKFIYNHLKKRDTFSSTPVFIIYGALAEDVFEKRHAQTYLIIRFKFSYSNGLKRMHIQMWVFFTITIFII